MWASRGTSISERTSARACAESPLVADSVTPKVREPENVRVSTSGISPSTSAVVSCGTMSTNASWPLRSWSATCVVSRAAARVRMSIGAGSGPQNLSLRFRVTVPCARSTLRTK